MACKKIKGKMRKMQGGGSATGGNPMGSLMSLAQYSNIGGSALSDTMGMAEPDQYGIINPHEAAASAGLSNVGYGPLSILSAVSSYRKTKKNNEQIQKQLNTNAAYAQLGRDGILPGQESYTPMMPFGGQVPYQNVGNETVELESGEPYRLPDGTIDAIPTSAPTHKQGGVPITLPAGTQVLGKKKAMNGKQFKELGRKLEKAQNKYQKSLDNRPTSLATRTAKRMLDNIQNEYTALFNAQGVDVGGQQMPNGGMIYKGDPTIKSYGFSTEQLQMAKDGDQLSQRPFYDPNSKELLGYKVIRKGQPGPTYEWFDPRRNVNSGVLPTEARQATSQSGIQEFKGGGKVGKRPMRKGQDGALISNVDSQWMVNDPLFTAPQVQQYNMAPEGTSTNPVPYANQMIDRPKSSTSFDYNSLLNTAGTLAPVAYNIGQGLSRADSLNEQDFINPYATGSQQLMRNRRYNIQPELEANASNAAAYNRRLREMGLSRGQIVGGLQTGNVAKTRADAETLARAQNVNNQYMAEQAQFDYGVGADTINRRFQIRDMNMRNQAAKKNYMATGLSQLGQYSQMQQLQKGQALRDQQRLNLLPSLVSNFKFDQNTGMWEHKTTGEKMTKDQAINWSYIYGNSNN